MFKIEVCIVLALLISFCMPSTCGGNCPSNTCTSCPCGTTVEHTVNVKEKCHRYNWNTNCCYCISTKRSGNSPGHMKFYKDSEGKVHELEGLFLLDKVDFFLCRVWLTAFVLGKGFAIMKIISLVHMNFIFIMQEPGNTLELKQNNVDAFLLKKR